MNNLNSILIEGNMVREPQYRTTPKGTPLCTFSLASNRYFRQENGYEREVSFFDVETWGEIFFLYPKFYPVFDCFSTEKNHLVQFGKNESQTFNTDETTIQYLDCMLDELENILDYLEKEIELIEDD